MTGEPRVFHLITRLLRGGAEAKTIRTVRGLEGFQFEVGYGAEYDQGQVELLRQSGIKTTRFSTIRHYKPASTVPAVLAVARHLHRGDYDIVHTHSTEAGIIGRFAAALARAPHVVHTVHGVPFSSDRNDLLNQFVLHCERWSARHTDRIVVNADALADDYLSRGIGRPDQYTTVYSGIDIESFQDASPAPDVDGDGVRLVMVGRMAEGKGFEDLLVAVKSLDDLDLSVYLVGDGPIRSRLESRVDDEEIEDTVHVLGFREDVPRILAACDVFVLPSYREGTPRVITEAMATGLPVIATDIAGIPEQVEDGTNGYLIQPGDVESLADRIRGLVISPRKRAEFGAAGEQYVERFSQEQMLADLEEIYRELLSS